MYWLQVDQQHRVTILQLSFLYLASISLTKDNIVFGQG